MSPVLETLQSAAGPVHLIVRANARNISLRLDHATRTAELVMPAKRHRARALKLLGEKQGWLAGQRAQLPAPMPFVDGGEIWLRGESVALRRSNGRSGHAVLPGELVIKAPEAAPFADRVRRTLIEMARADITRAVTRAAATLELDFGRITVRDTRSRWGSCSHAGNLNFSWRLICAPTEVLQYVAVHEVSHLRHPHHGAAFWAEVAKAWPDYKAQRKQLHQWAPQLFAVGADR